MRVVCLLIVALAALTFAATSHAAIVEDQDYIVLSPPQPTMPGKRVEIIEFFAYDCPHCNALEPPLTEWVRAHAGKIIFKRGYASQNDHPEPLQRLYYALETMGKVDEYQAKIFSAIFVQRTRVKTDADALDLATKLGLDRGTFASAYNSFKVQTMVHRAPEMLSNYRINTWPSLVVDGQYVTSPVLAGARLGSDNNESASAALSIKVMDELVDQQLSARLK
jgi:protein dithiol oxidoreductase (disulfide-forming)